MPRITSSGSGYCNRWDIRLFSVLFVASITSFAALHLSTRDIMFYGQEPYHPELTDVGDNYNYSLERKVLVLMWDGMTPFGWGEGEIVETPNYGGFRYEKGKCPVQCEWTVDRALLPVADTLLFDPCLTGPTGYRDIPVYMPDKLPNQKWGWFTYEQYFYFPMMKEMEYMNRFDYKMTYHHDAEVQITFACPWAGITDLTAPPPDKVKEKIVAVFISNCNTGGADIRLQYIEELMKHMPVDSFGACLKNKDYYYGGGGSHGSKMKDKLRAISEYKFLLAFENNMVDDYVTEKLINAYQAGTVPVYMGSSTIDKWAIAPHSLIKTSDYPQAKDLAKYLLHLNDNDDEYMEYFAWKETGISASFQKLWANCFAFAECRLCKYIARTRKRDGGYQKPKELPDSGVIGHALQFNGLDSDLYGGDDYVEIPHNLKLDLTTEYTLMAWIKLGLITDGRIIDKNQAGDIAGYNLDVVPAPNNRAHGVLRLCAGEGCYHANRELRLGLWYHVAVTFNSISRKENSIKFYINGKFDNEQKTGKATATNNIPLRFGRATGGGSWRPHHAASVYDGVLDEISIWDKALEEKAIYKYMFERPKGNEKNLVGWWNFNEGSGDTVHDIGRNELHGRIVGHPVWIVSVSKPNLDSSNAEARYY